MASETFQAASIIEEHLAESWDENVAPIHWPGTKFAPPDGPWMRLVINWGDGFEDTMGPTNLNRLVGIIIISIFDKPGSGEGGINELADMVRDLFNRQILEDVVRCKAASPPQPAGEGDKSWQQINVNIPFEVEETV